ncbi:hypothetical protein ILYODFUR_037760 [Ilyodon furcidens]|uniref:VWA7 N-terminal domain-containing protein n=1 Tax=Ilyodon furcidens TaxID=33524 RepID=A0ABV0SSF0_9TELE
MIASAVFASIFSTFERQVLTNKQKCLLSLWREGGIDRITDYGERESSGTSPGELVQACLGPRAPGEVSGAKFLSALQEIYTQNGLVDRDFVNSAPHHFNSEAFLEGRGLITEGMVAIKANIRKENFKAARETLGRVLHTLQVRWAQ